MPGGSKGSASMAAFSQGLSWANFDLGVNLLGNNGDSNTTEPTGNVTVAGTNGTEDTDAADRRRWSLDRRSTKSNAKDSNTKDKSGKKHTKEEKTSSDGCGVQNLLAPVQVLVICSFLLLLVFCARSLTVFVITRYIHKEQPATLLFPAWSLPLPLPLPLFSLFSLSSLSSSLSLSLSLGTHTHTHAHTHVHTHAHARTRARTHTHAHAHAHARTCMRMRTHTYIHAHMHKQTKTHTHTHAHTRREGPVFLAQYLGLCDSGMAAMALQCAPGRAIGIPIICFGPMLFLVSATFYIMKLVEAGKLNYEENPRPSFAELKVNHFCKVFCVRERAGARLFSICVYVRMCACAWVSVWVLLRHICKQDKILRTKGTIGKIVVAYAYFTGAFEKGSWTDDQNSAYWGFLVSVGYVSLFFLSHSYGIHKRARMSNLVSPFSIP